MMTTTATFIEMQQMVRQTLADYMQGQQLERAAHEITVLAQAAHDPDCLPMQLYELRGQPVPQRRHQPRKAT